MRREIALMLLPWLAAQGCASGNLPRPGGGGPADLEAVNRALEDRPAIVELRSGERVHDVEEVKMTAESTSWRDGDQVRTVPTGDVVRVTRQVPRRLWSGLGWGVLAGLPVGFLVASHQKSGGFIASDQEVYAFIYTVLGCGLLGMVISGATRHDQVVYVAPAARAAAAASGGGAVRIGAAAGSGSDGRHCRLASAQAPPGAPAIECAPATATAAPAAVSAGVAATVSEASPAPAGR